jgi:hypothetical protein
VNGLQRRFKVIGFGSSVGYENVAGTPTSFGVDEYGAATVGGAVWFGVQYFMEAGDEVAMQKTDGTAHQQYSIGFVGRAPYSCFIVTKVNTFASTTGLAV